MNPFINISRYIILTHRGSPCKMHLPVLIRHHIYVATPWEDAWPPRAKTFMPWSRTTHLPRWFLPQTSICRPRQMPYYNALNIFVPFSRRIPSNATFDSNLGMNVWLKRFLNHSEIHMMAPVHALIVIKFVPICVYSGNTSINIHVLVFAPPRERWLRSRRDQSSGCTWDINPSRASY